MGDALSDVAFRRIHGRVIPIRINDPDHNTIKGGALVGAGVGAGYAVGKASAKLMHESALVENTARILQRNRHQELTKAIKQGPLFTHAAEQASKASSEAVRFNLKRSKQLEKAAFRLRNVGTAASAALIGAGVHKIMAGQKNENPKTNAAVSTASGVGAAFVIRSAYLRGVGMRGFKVLKHAARRAFLKL